MGTTDKLENYISMITHSLVHYFGSKFNATSVLKPYFPAFTNTDQYYFDVFAGSLSMCFALNPKSVILNDKWDALINFWICVKEHCTELNQELEYVWASPYWYDHYQQRTDPVGKAIFFYISHLWSRGLPKDTFRYYYNSARVVKDFSLWKSWFDSRNSLVIWNLDFREVLTKIASYGEDTTKSHVIYCDPPYVSFGHSYNVPFNSQDHTDLLTLLTPLYDQPNKWVFLSYDDCPQIREQYSNWYMKEVSWKVGAGVSRGSDDYHELLISNRPIKPQQTISTALTDFFKVK